MYALVENDVLVEFPISINTLKVRYPNVTFPKSFADFDYTSYGVVEVIDPGQPDFDDNTHRVNSTSVGFVDGAWTIIYNVAPFTAEELAIRTQDAANYVRADRNKRLTETDWRVTYEVEKAAIDGLGVQLPTVWSDYRQALRDITSQPGFPHNVTWPTEPTT